ncbi:hypothetical protein MTR67_044213 [Solanum verrucosum]|uniref:Uncharacterized protein n=1 Tax=Solanum verrucosum TaxID=315347 RepID=A0AAF0UQ71_SOLVR|nr:hypothetical protein MTR67_044213 [Solanum verrucosum]
MLQEGVEPYQVVFVVVLTACSHGGLVGERMKILTRVDIIKKKTHANDAVWGHFLAACKMHKDNERATYEVDMISESSPPPPDKAGIHVLLPNVYALGGKWTDVANVSISMKEREKKKNPDSS